MKRARTMSVVLAVVGLPLALAGCSQPPPAPAPASIHIRFDPSPGYEVSPYLAGGFIEFIGGVIDGRDGLWAQELRNRGLDWPDDNGDGVSDGLSSTGEASWMPVSSGRNTAAWSLGRGGYNRPGVHAQEVRVFSLEDGACGVVQDGVQLRGDTAYQVYVYLRGEGIEGGVTVSLSDPHTGAIHDAVRFQGITGSWQRCPTWTCR